MTETALKQARLSVSELRPLNVQLLVELCAKAREAVLQVEGKDIVLLLGMTGAGKSLTIHYQSGSQLLRLPEMGHIVPIELPAAIGATMLQQVKPSQSATSEIGYLTAVPRDITTVGGIQRLLLSDTPGFRQTRVARIITIYVGIQLAGQFFWSRAGSIESALPGFLLSPTII